jgi:hypothetical protein
LLELDPRKSLALALEPQVKLTNQTVAGNQSTTIGPCVVAYQ